MSKTFYIQIGGEQVPVTEEVYRAFKRPAWAEDKRWKVRIDRERSLERLIADGFDIPSDDPLVDEIVADKFLLDMLMLALDKLTDDERGLVDALFFEEKSEREVARETGVPHQTVHSRKAAILRKLKSWLSIF